MMTESKFKMFASDWCHYLRCGSSIMIRSGILVSGVGEFLKIAAIVKTENYCQIMIHHATPSGKYPIGNGLISQQ